MKVTVSVTLDVTPCNPDEFQNPGTDEIKRCVIQAIRHAVAYGQGEGHVHDLSEHLSIIMDDVTASNVEGSL